MPPASQNVAEITDRARTLAASLDEIVWLSTRPTTLRNLLWIIFFRMRRIIGHCRDSLPVEVAGSLPSALERGGAA